MKRLGYALLTLLLLATVGGAQVGRLIVKDSPWIDVRAYGAVADGTTDSTLGIQTALDNATAGGIILFSPGTYLISDTLTVPDSVTLRGDGRTSIVKLAADSNVPMFENENYDITLAADAQIDITFDGLVLDGNITNQSDKGDGLTDMTGVRMTNVLNFKFLNGKIYNTGKDCITLWRSHQFVVDNNVFYGCYNHGTTITGSDHGRFSNNILHDLGSKTDALGWSNSGHGFIATSGDGSSDYITVVDNDIYDIGDSGIRNEIDGEGWLIAGNRIVNNGKDAIKVMSSDDGITQPEANVIANNVVVDAGACGIRANGSHVLVIGNTVDTTGTNVGNKGGATEPCISATEASDNVVITGNVCQNANGEGITVSDVGGDAGAGLAEGPIIKNNEVSSCGTDGIYCYDCNGATIENNVVYDNSATTTNTSSGIRIGDDTSSSYSRHSIRFNRVFNTGATGQKYGLRLEGGANVSYSIVQYNDLYGGVTSNLYTNWSGTGNFINYNRGYVTENSGTATLINGNTTISFAHGLAITPTKSQILVTPQESLGAASFFFVSAVSSSNIIIAVNTDPGQDVDFTWRVFSDIQ